MYIACMRELCHQIGVPADSFHEEIAFLPHDNILTRSTKVIQAIEMMKERMKLIMDGLRVFLILDDVWCHEDVELFNFGEGMKSSFTLFITTRTLDMFPSTGACWIDIPLLSPPDAVSFFFLESGRGDKVPTDEEFLVTKQIVEKCGYLPLAIRIAAKVAQAYPRFMYSENGLEEIPRIVATNKIDCICDSSPNSQTVTNLLNRSFSYITDADVSHALKICFGAMAVVFHKDDNLRPWVSQKFVEKLWCELLTECDELREYKPKLKKYRISTISSITNLLNIMGLIDKRKRKEDEKSADGFQIQIHHDLLFEYGKMVAIEFQKDRVDSKKCSDQSTLLGNHFSGENEMHFQNILIDWNNLLVNCCQDSLKLSKSDLNVSYDEHRLYWLPHHMIKARKLSAVIDLLSKKKFLRERIAYFGFLEGTKLYISDIREIQNIEEKLSKWNNQSNLHENVVSKAKVRTIMFMIGDFLSDFDCSILSQKSKTENGHALVLLGVTEQAFASWHESLECYNKALQIFQSTGLDENHPFIISVMKHIDVYAILPIWLVPETSQYCVKLKYSKQLADFDYGPTGLPLELSSHPGKGIARVEDFLKAQSEYVNRKGLCFAAIGPKEGSLRVIRQGNSIRCTQSNCFFRIYHSIVDGAPLVWSSPEEKVEAKAEWIIRDDGKVSPVQATNLCLGTSPLSHLHLVEKDSPNQVNFENYLELKETQNQVYSSKWKRVPLKLSSHPNCGLRYRVGTPNWDIQFITIFPLFIGGGPEEKSIRARLSEKGEIILDETGKCVVRAVGNILEDGNAMIGTIDNSDQPRPGQPFQVNDNGSISPVEAPHLVLGFPQVGTVSNALSSEIKKKSIIKEKESPDLLNEEVLEYISRYM
uniref:Uncharacterized protein n=1 Tax=Corethron hystrix TaxID=216773 RepID=A0A6U5HLF9_9STRA|mmetsp:Transcript_30936/g.70709  ORF Transcript_30936/g.70709 Transcript_30936/m.70709 type:complete len:874 (+) Transcript_30936:540-3161(+)